MHFHHLKKNGLSLGIYIPIGIITILLLTSCINEPIEVQRLSVIHNRPLLDENLKQIYIENITQCNKQNDAKLILDKTKPLTILVHGCWSSSSQLNTLSEVFEFHGQQTVCFNYDDRASMERSAEHLNRSLMAIFTSTGINEITVIGHSQGGLVSRRALVDKRQWDKRTEKVSLVTISSPFAGITAAEHCGSDTITYFSLGLSRILCSLIAGDKWDEIHPNATFISQPGALVDGVTSHLKIVTDELDSCRVSSSDGNCHEDDYVFSLKEQYLDVIDKDKLVKNVEIKEGHVAIIGNEQKAPLKLISVFHDNAILAKTPAEKIKGFEQMLADLY